jgi:hypothetical protein
MIRAIAVAAIALAGCGKLFGIEEIPYQGGSNSDGGGDGARDSTTFMDAHPANVTLTVQNMVPAGTLGTIRSVPGNIVCGPGSPMSMCTAVLPWGTVVRLDPDPSAGGTFSVWDGACKGQTPNVVPMVGHCDLTLTRDVTAIASFTNDFTLNLSPTNTVVGLPTARVQVQAPFGGGGDCRIGDVCSFHFGTTLPSNITVQAPADDQCTKFVSLVGPGCGPGMNQCFPQAGGGQLVMWVDYTFTSTGNAGCP